MRIIAPLLLCLLSAVVEVHSVTAPYLTFLGQNIHNNSYVDLTKVGRSSSNDLQCHSDLGTCCSSIEGPHRGDWYLPNGMRLNFVHRVSMARRFRIVALRYDCNQPLDYKWNGDISGIYRCDIETLAFHNNSRKETLYVGLYTSTSGGDVTIPGGMTFTVDSNLNGDSLQFILTCTSTGGPATTVTWNRDSETVSGGMTVLNNAVTAQYTHTLTVTERLGGQYQCKVENKKPSTATAQFTVQVASPPTNVNATLQNSTTLILSWTPPNPLGDTTGYKIFYSSNSSIGSRIINGGNVNSYQLFTPHVYNISIMGTSDHLPSKRVNITLSSLMNDTLNVMVDSTTSTTISLSWTLGNGIVPCDYVVTWEKTSTGYCGNTRVPSAPPQSVQISDVNASSITVEWEPVDSDNCNEDITGYLVRYTVKGSNNSMSRNVLGGQTNLTTISKLSAFTTYTIEVAAMTSNGTGVYSDPIDVLTGGGDINVLENVNFTMEFDHIGCKTMFTLTVTSNGGPAKSVTWTRGSEIQSNTWTSYDNVTMQYTHNLNVTSRRGGRYQCTLENDKPSMIAKNFKVKVASAPTGFKAVQQNLTSIHLFWNPPTPLGDTTGYRIYYSGGSSDSKNVSVHTTTHEYLLTGLQNGASYNICIVGTSDHLPSDCVCLSNIILEQLMGSSTSNSISIAWNFFNKKKRSLPDECRNVKIENINGGSTTYNISGLDKGSTYNITVTARCNSGREFHVSLENMTKEAVPSAPPTQVAITQVNSSIIIVQWNAVDCIHHNGRITGYSVRYGVYESGIYKNMMISGVDCTESTISELCANTTYTIEVAAINSAGIGNYSRYKTVDTLIKEMNTPTITITDGGNYANIWNEIEIKVSWDPALGNNSFYKVNCTPLQSIYMHYCPSEVIEVSGRNSTTSIVVSPTPGMGFEFKIQSCVRIGNKQFNGTETNVTIVFEGYIQIQFGPVKHCSTWGREYAELFERQLQMQIKKAIFKNSFSMYRQFNNSVMMPGVFTCRNYSHNMATYRSGLFNPGLPGPSNANRLLDYVQDWVESSPVVRLVWFMVDINQDCPVHIRGLNDTECPPSSPE